jgi:simple sugar transport system substrate-binding protein
MTDTRRGRSLWSARPVRAGVAAIAAAALLASCTGADDNGEAAEETNGEAVEAAEATEAEGDKWCSGVSIAAFPGGGQGTPFTNNVYNGYRAAEEDLGPSVTYYFSDWSVETMIAQFREAMALNPDGMSVMGHPGDAAMGPLIDEAYEAGTQVTVVNVELPEAMDRHAAEGLGYVGAPNYAAGKRLAEETVRRSEAQAGEQAFVWGLVAEAGRGERTQGIIDGFEEAGIDVVYQEIDAATNADAQAGVPTFTGVISANPDVSIVVTDHGALTATAETYATAAGLEPGEVYFAGFDLGPATVEAIKSGYLDLVIDQQPFLQGYLPILQICLTQVYGFSGLYIDTAGSFVDSDNVDFVEPLARQEIR